MWVARLFLFATIRRQSRAIINLAWLSIKQFRRRTALKKTPFHPPPPTKMLIVPQVDFWVVFGMEKLAEQKAEDALKIGPFMVPHMCVCVSAKFLKFYDRMAARAKNAKSAAPSTTKSAKNFYANFHPPKLGKAEVGLDWRWIQHQVENFHSIPTRSTQCRRNVCLEFGRALFMAQ